MEANVLLELQLEVEAVWSSSNLRSHGLSQIVGGSSCRERESKGRFVSAWPQSILDGRSWKRTISEFVWRDSIEWHGQKRCNGVIGKLHSSNCSVGGEGSSESRSAHSSSSGEDNSGEDGSSESSLVLRNEDGEGIEHNVHVGIILKTGHQLLSWDIAELESNTLNVSSSGVLELLSLSRESHVDWVRGSWLEETNSLVRCKVASYSEVSLEATNQRSVEGSSVVACNVSLGLEFSEVWIEIVVNHVDISKGERRLLSKFEVLAVCGNISSTRESWLSIWKGEGRCKRILLGETHRYQKSSDQ